MGTSLQRFKILNFFLQNGLTSCCLGCTLLLADKLFSDGNCSGVNSVQKKSVALTSFAPKMGLFLREVAA